ncbi:hypothetical protein BX070DRAFT_228648 [Coemansia spiralis]|nr:hypothetical protein BX070DRAFT_228648 [Coemansia spiralis]
MIGSLSLKAVLGTTLALSSISTLVHGLFPDEAGRIDWYREQMGVPKKIVPYTGGNGTSIFAITHRNVLASLNPNSGEIIWRQVFGDSEPINTLQLRDDQALTHSGANESYVRVWDAATGSLKWEFSHPEAPTYKPSSGAAAFLDGNKDVLAVVGDSLVRLSADQSKPVWEVSLNRTATYKRIVVQGDVAYAIGDATQTSKARQQRLHVIEVNLATGSLAKQYDIANGMSLGSDNLVVIESKEYGAYVVWREEKNIVWMIHRLGMIKPMWDIYHAKIVQVELMPEDMLASTISELDLDPGLNENVPRFALTYTKEGKTKTVVVEMFRTDDKLDMRKVVGFRSDKGVVASFGSALPVNEANKSAQKQRTVVSVRSYNNSVAWRIYSDDKAPTHTGEFAYNPATYGPVTGASLYYTNNDEPRVLVQTGGGLLAALAPNTDGPLWSRDESLAHATDMAFMELPPPASSAEHAAKATDPSVVNSPLVRYILRWVETTKSLTMWVSSGFGLLDSTDNTASSSADLASRSVAEALVPTSPLTTGDHFGFRKLSIFGTSTGVVAALSTQDGTRSWTHWFADNGTSVKVEHIFVTRRTQPLSEDAALVTVVGRNARGKTVVADLDALTGLPASENAIQWLASGHTKVFELPVVDTATNQQLIGIITDGKEPQFRIWPSTAAGAKAFFAISDTVFFDLGGSKGSIQLRGYSIERSSELEISSWNKDSVASTKRQWAFDLPEGEILVKETEYRNGAQNTALLGRVLGDRSVLYKYINPHLVTLATLRSEGGIGIYFIDRVSGRLLHSAIHKNARVTAKQPFLGIQTENRVIYQLWQDGSFAPVSSNSTGKHQATTSGYITVVAELFESDKPDTREDSKAFSSYDILLPSVVTTAFTAPEAASALGITRTGSHITTRDVLFGLVSNKLLSLPDQLFDPRRPKEAPTKDEQAEGLVPYAAPLVLDPKRVLSHYNTVAGIKFISSAPTHLESTSLVASFGLDMFFTRTSPSGTFDQLSPSFSKVNLVVTTLALVIGCLLGGPMVRRKMTNQAWE